MRCITLVRFPAPAGLRGAKLRAALEDSMPRRQVAPGLALVDKETHTSRIDA